MRLLRSLTAFGSIASAGIAGAASIAMNFPQGTNQAFSGGAPIGPTGINSTNWNSSLDTNPDGTQTSLGTGSKDPLIDDSGAATSATITFSSANTFYNREDDTSDDENKLAVGYLDDGGDGISISVGSIPYDQYRLYILLSSDMARFEPNYFTNDNLTVNGLNVYGQIINGDNTPTFVTAYGSIADANAGGGASWVEVLGDGAGNQTQIGNYVTLELSGDLTITSSISPDISGTTDGRGGIAGIIIEQIPEPSTSLLTMIAGLGFLVRRRR